MSKPRVPAPTPVVERQPYKNAPSRESLSSGMDPNERRRMIAGVATSAQGLLDPASTTRRVLAGGDQQLNPTLGGSGSSTPSVLTPPAAPTGPLQGPQTGGGNRQPSKKGYRPTDAWVGQFLRRSMAGA